MVAPTGRADVLDVLDPYRSADRKMGLVAKFVASRSTLEQALVALETDADVRFVRAQAGSGGATGAAAADAAARFEEIWARYLLVREVARRAEAAADAGRHGAATRMITAVSIALPDGGTTSAWHLVAELQESVDELTDRASGIAGAARRSIAGLDAATGALEQVRQLATELGAADDPEIVTACRALEQVTAALAADPATTDVGAYVDVALEAARRHVDELVRQRSTLADRLREAGCQLDELALLIRRGAEAHVEARRKVAEPVELLEPLPLDLEEELRRSLADIAQLAEAGRWRAASDRLSRWQRQAGSTMRKARNVASVDHAPVAARNELRGRLEAYRAKAAAIGRNEDRELAELYKEAHAALYVAPCDLPKSRRAVQAYVEAVNARTGTGPE